MARSTSRPSRRRFRSLAARLEAWFVRSARELPWRRSYDPWQVWVSEVMLQQTRMEVVLPYFERFLARFPTVEALAAAPEEEVLACWSGLGYYRRAKLLHQGARRVVEQGGTIPREAALLRTLPGVGRYTAGAIASIAFDRPEPIVDGNVARLVARLEALEARAGSARSEAALWSWAEGIVLAAESPRRLNQALMELGAMLCRPRAPRCGECPVRGSCAARRSGTPEAYPRPATAAAARILTIPLFIVADRRGRVLLERGHPSRLMRGMFHLPHGSPELLGRDDSPRFRRVERIGSFRHTITNRRILFDVWRAETAAAGIAEREGEALWIDAGSLATVPHPSYVRKALAIAGLA